MRIKTSVGTLIRSSLLLSPAVLIGVGLQQISTQALQVKSAFGATSVVEPVDANIFVKLSKKMIPSVVNISTITTVKSPFAQGSPDDVLRKFFGDLFRQYNGGGGRGHEGEEEEEEMPFPQGRSPSRSPKAMSLGTGFIIDSSGLILTNNHVVADADEIKIMFTEATDEKPSDAEVVGRDPEIDVALIKVKSRREMLPVVLGDSDALEVGEYVMAVGNPFGQGHSVTHGIISAKGRQAPEFPLANYLQTDAPINPGNSGGPLVNLKGEVIGINNAIDQRAQGIGFAIPIQLVKSVLPELRTKGTVARGFIGVLVDNLTPDITVKIGVPKDFQGPVVTHVYPGEPADRAGVKPYDVIVELNKKPIHSDSELIAGVTSLTVGQTVPLKVRRGKKEMLLSIKVGQRPGVQQVNEKKHNQSSPGKNKKKPPVETGMSLEDITPEVARELGISEKSSGIVVADVADGSPGEQAGLGRGDVILEVDRKPIKNVESFYAVVKEKKTYLLRARRTDPQGNEVFQVVILNLKE
jgi:serine protease Do